jgi:hypothetical protein
MVWCLIKHRDLYVSLFYNIYSSYWRASELNVQVSLTVFLEKCDYIYIILVFPLGL